jgi:uncharacterized protein (TIGR00369 family)
MGDPERSLEISWEDPAALAQRARETSGLEFLKAIAAGELPRAPIQEVLGYELTEADEGRVVFTGTPGERHYNPIGVVHAGFAATLIDSACGACVHTTLAPGEAYTTLETKFNLVRPVTGETGEVSCEGTVVHRGRRMATSEARLTGADGKLLAHGTSTCMIFEA